MALDEDAQRVLDLFGAGRPPVMSLTPAEARAASLASRQQMQRQLDPIARVEDHTIQTNGAEIGVRCYWPRVDAASLPG